MYKVQTKVESTKFEGRTAAGKSQTLYFVIRTSYFELSHHPPFHLVLQILRNKFLNPEEMLHATSLPGQRWGNRDWLAAPWDGACID
jgi:hypothetical protein